MCLSSGVSQQDWEKQVAGAFLHSYLELHGDLGDHRSTPWGGNTEVEGEGQSRICPQGWRPPGQPRLLAVLSSLPRDLGRQESPGRFPEFQGQDAEGRTGCWTNRSKVRLRIQTRPGKLDGAP